MSFPIQSCRDGCSVGITKTSAICPGRADRDPYHVWLSEIMLQQTRVEAVKAYYARFLQVLPTIADLAEADDGLLQKLWEGLGYYTRVRNLKKAAQQIMTEYGGQFPNSHAEILRLAGIGPYTAGAIGSICFELPTPAVDGNVLRVITRLSACADPIDLPATRRTITDALAAVYPEGACGDFTQSLMELGATVCGPNGAPACLLCPVSDLCRARRAGQQTHYPVKGAKRHAVLSPAPSFYFGATDGLPCKSGPLKDFWQDYGSFPIIWETAQPNRHWKRQLSFSSVLMSSLNLYMQFTFSPTLNGICAVMRFSAEAPAVHIPG